MTEKPDHKMAMAMLEVIAVVADRHGLNPTRPKDLPTLMLTLGAVLMSILRTGDPGAHGITIRDETRKGVPGTAVTVHRDKEESAA